MTVKELGTIAVPEPQMITVSPWDKALIPVIAKAIRESELKLNPTEEGGLVRIPIPALTEDRRKEFAKLVAAKVEESRQSIRNIRQDAMKLVEKEFTDKLIGEDEKFTRKDEIEETVRSVVSDIEALGEEKKSDILKI